MKNADADGMSCYPHNKANNTDMEIVQNETVKALCGNTVALPCPEILPCHPIRIVEAKEDIGQGLAQLEMREFHKLQRADGLISGE